MFEVLDRNIDVCVCDVESKKASERVFGNEAKINRRRKDKVKSSRQKYEHNLFQVVDTRKRREREGKVVNSRVQNAKKLDRNFCKSLELDHLHENRYSELTRPA